jgi:hypothetical protein
MLPETDKICGMERVSVISTVQAVALQVTTTVSLKVEIEKTVAN